MSNEFTIFSIGLHQESTLNPCLFILVMDKLTGHGLDIHYRCILFVNDIVLVDENLDRINSKLGLRRQTLKTRSFKLSRNETRYMRCNFNNKVLLSKSSMYLRSIFQQDKYIDEVE